MELRLLTCRRCCCLLVCLLPPSPPPHTQEGAARPEIIAEVASSLADMLYATGKMTAAKEALQVSWWVVGLRVYI